MLTLNRPPNPRTGVAHGGVAVIYKKGMGNFKVIQHHNPEGYEVLPTIGTLCGTTRKMIVVAVYIPPNYSVPKGNACLDYVENLILDLKRKYRDPYIVVGGDFNQWQIQTALQEYPDMSEIHVGPTRRDRAIDRIFCNMARSVQTSGTLPPLEAESSESDHRIAHFTARLPRQESYEWVTYSYRHFTEEAQAEFGQWLVLEHWTEVFCAVGSDAKAAAYQKKIDGAMDIFFPLRTVRKSQTTYRG